MNATWVTVLLFLALHGAAICYAAGRISSELKTLNAGFKQMNEDNKDNLRVVHERINETDANHIRLDSRVTRIEAEHQIIHGGKVGHSCAN